MFDEEKSVLDLKELKFVVDKTEVYDDREMDIKGMFDEEDRKLALDLDELKCIHVYEVNVMK